MKSHERRRQRQASDSAQQATNNATPGTGQASGSHGAPRSANFPPAPHATQLPAIRSQPPHSAPRVEALEPPVTPQSVPRRDAKITPLHPARPGSSNHPHSSHLSPHPSAPHGQSSRPLPVHQPTHGGDTALGSGGALRSPPSRRPGAPQHQPPNHQHAGAAAPFDNIHGRNGASASRTFPSNRSGPGSGTSSTAPGAGAAGGSGASGSSSGASTGMTSGTAHRLPPNERRSKNGQRPARSHRQ
jgi:hypothetical protein